MIELPELKSAETKRAVVVQRARIPYPERAGVAELTYARLILAIEMSRVTMSICPEDRSFISHGDCCFNFNHARNHLIYGFRFAL
jgi:hypothetical protein